MPRKEDTSKAPTTIKEGYMKQVYKAKTKNKIINIKVSEEFKKNFEKKCHEVKEHRSVVLRSLMIQFMLGDIAA